LCKAHFSIMLNVQHNRKGQLMVTILSFIGSWFNLPFTTLILFGLLLSALQLIGLGGDTEDSADGDLDHDLDAGLDHDLSADLGHDLDSDLDHDLDAQVDHDLDAGVDHSMDHDAGELDQAAEHDLDASGGAAHGAASATSLLAFLGVGKAPLLVVLLILLDLVGMLGWAFNGLASSYFNPYPALLFPFVSAASLLIGGVFTSRITRFIGRTLPPISTTVTRAQALVGMCGTVISPFVDEKYGQVHLRIQDRTLITVFVVNDGLETIRRGDEVILVDYNPNRRIYTVTRSSSQ
jgi:membrane protein implicated in regulation of membrane protease activity